MKEIKVAKSAGFCFGVEKAVKTVYKEIEEKSGRVYTLGPIIHNERVVADLDSKGVEVIDNIDDISNKPPGTLIIRSHGVSRKVHEVCLASAMRVVDATCPYVKKIHRIVANECEKGHKVVIIGNPSHPEVEGIKGWGDDATVAIESYEDFVKLHIEKRLKLSIVAQTTYNYNKFKEILDKIKVLEYDITCFNTICNATQERQSEAKAIASEVDTMIVVGGKHSSNTAKLVDICKGRCSSTIFIQTLDDLNPDDLISAKSVGITAGASTPKHIIEEVQNHVRSKF